MEVVRAGRPGCAVLLDIRSQCQTFVVAIGRAGIPG